MKKIKIVLSIVLAALITTGLGLVLINNTAIASSINDDGCIKTGIYAGDIDLSGMSADQARQAVESYISSVSDKSIALKAVDDNEVVVTAKEMGLYWKNPEIIDEAVSLGRVGNIVKRFKTLKDLEREKKSFDIVLGVDDSKLRNIIETNCLQFNQEAIDASLERTDGQFVVTPGQDGLVVDVDDSISKVKTYMETLWQGQDGSVDLSIAVEQPKGRTEDLEQVKDVLGTFTTSFKTSASGRSANVRNGCSHIDGTLLYPGDQLSVYEKVSPFTEENGYYLAGSYNNGLVVETLGGGICQVSSTLYNAVIRAELQVDERSNHSMVVTYVDLSADAAISGTAKDFKFTNSTAYPIYIEGHTTDDKKISFTIYGKEERPEGRTLEFETEKLSETVPEGDKVVADPSQPVGYSTTQSAHIGYTANYWKIVKENGVETERVKLNSSTYMAVPRTITYGTAGDVTGTMAAAIATQDGAYCSAVSAELVNVANAASIANAEEAAQEVAQEAID